MLSQIRCCTRRQAPALGRASVPECVVVSRAWSRDPAALPLRTLRFGAVVAPRPAPHARARLSLRGLPAAARRSMTTAKSEGPGFLS
jgi:hypothetical protein